MTKGNVAALYHCENDSYYLYVVDDGLAIGINEYIWEVGFTDILEDEVEIET